MPRPKKSPLDYRPGQRDLEEVKNYERLMRTQKLERTLRDVLPSPDAVGDTARLLPMLHLFQQENDRQPRANITLTLSLRTIEMVAWLEHETAMKRGKVIDWMFAGFWARFQEFKEEQYREARREARLKATTRDKDKDEDDSDSDDTEDDE